MTTRPGYPRRFSAVTNPVGRERDSRSAIGNRGTALLARPTPLPVRVVHPDSPPPEIAEQSGTPRVDRTTWQRRYVTGLVVSDTVVVCAAVAFAQLVRFGLPPFLPGPENRYFTACSVLVAAIWLVTLAVFHTRSAQILGRGQEEYRRVLAASVWTIGIVAMTGFLLKVEIARGYLAVALPVGILGLALNRWLARQHVAHRRIDGSYQTAVLAVGTSDAVQGLAEELTRRPSDGIRVVGACILSHQSASGEPLLVRGEAVPIVGSQTCDLETLIRKCNADTLAIVGTQHLGILELRRLIWKLEPMGVDLVVSSGVMDIASSRLTMLPVSGLPLLHIGKPQYRGAVRIPKRAFDFCFAVAALIATLPILLIAAITIKATSRGPVFYASERIGLGGRPFRVMKLRTMVKDADQKLVNLLGRNECDGQLFKIKDDPRITRVGQILRRFSIDELPQFINVVRGEMSVVGPRPLFLLEGGEFDSDAERRLLVKPGVTGLWQVSGRSNLSWDEAIRLDLSYVDNWSMSTDLLIVAKTLRAVFQHEGAY